MNEQLRELLDAVRQTAAQASGAAADAAYSAGKWAGGKLHDARRRIRIAALEGRVEGCFAEIGEMLYATHTGTPTESEALLAKLREIDALQTRVGQLEQEISRLQGGAVCPFCGASAQKGDVFCRECGGKL